jgi:hypothetical protein
MQGVAASTMRWKIESWGSIYSTMASRVVNSAANWRIATRGTRSFTKQTVNQGQHQNAIKRPAGPLEKRSQVASSMRKNTAENSTVRFKQVSIRIP